MKWILLVLLYGLLKGAREIAKKKAMEINNEIRIPNNKTIFLNVNHDCCSQQCEA